MKHQGGHIEGLRGGGKDMTTQSMIDQETLAGQEHKAYRQHLDRSIRKANKYPGYVAGFVMYNIDSVHHDYWPNTSEGKFHAVY